MIKTLFLALLCAGPVCAQSFPDTYSTTGIGADDTLNIRAEPNGSSEIIGEYQPYAINIEVVRTTDDGNWGLVGTGEGNGWVAMRFLEAQNHQDPDKFYRPMRCFGTEPFWGLTVGVRGSEYKELGFDRVDLEMINEDRTSVNGVAVFEESGSTLVRTLIAQKGYCNDGMSDQEYGLRATLLNTTPQGNAIQSGCCTLDASN